MKRVAQAVAAILFWAPSIIFGVYAGERIPSGWVGRWGVGLLVGLGVLAMEGALLALLERIAKKKTREPYQ